MREKINIFDCRELWFACTPAGEIELVEGDVTAWLGVEAGEVVGCNLNDLIEAADRQYLEATLRDPQRHAREPHYVQVHMQRESGKIAIFDLSGCLINGQRWVVLRAQESGVYGIEMGKESAELLRKAERLSQVGFWDWQIDTGELFWTEGIYNLFGFENADFTPTFDGFIALIDERDRKYVQESVGVAVEDGVPYSIQHRLRRMDGTIIWVQETGEIQRNAAGDPVRMYGTTRDITEQKRAAETELRLTALLEQTYDLVSIVDAWGNLIYLNAAGRDVLGYGVEEDLSAVTSWDFHPHWWHQKIQNEILPEFLESDFWEGRAWLQHRDGREIPAWQVWMVFRDDQEKVIYHATVIRDLSKIMEGSEKMSGQVLDSMIKALDHSEMIVWGFTLTGGIKFAYGRGLRKFGLLAADLPGRKLLEVFPGNEPLIRHLQLGLSGNENTSRFELDGHTIESFYEFTSDDNGRADGLVGVTFFPVNGAPDG